MTETSAPLRSDDFVAIKPDETELLRRELVAAFKKLAEQDEPHSQPFLLEVRRVAREMAELGRRRAMSGLD